MFALPGFVQWFGLQFCFPNIDVVPDSIRDLEVETLEERDRRLNRRGSGRQIIGSTENCSLTEFLSDLAESDYRLVDAFYQPRIYLRDRRGKRIYHVVRFSFVPGGSESNRSHFTGEDLRTMCEEALWRVRVFLNPYWKNGREILEQHALMIQLDARRPLFGFDGQPVTVWQKDERGERVGEAPLPLSPDYHLRMVNNVIQLIGA